MSGPVSAVAAAVGADGAVVVIAGTTGLARAVAQHDADRGRLVTGKVVGYTEVVHALWSRFTEHASIVLFGGLAKERPYPGPTSISTVNDAITWIVPTLAVELAAVRVNGLHPGVVGDHPEWSRRPRGILDALVARTPLGRLSTTQEVVDATDFLLAHRSVNGMNLSVDGGWMLT